MESFNPNKLLKEQFVSYQTGSSMLEIFFLISALSVLILIRHCIGFNFPDSGSVKKDDDGGANGKNLKAYIMALIVDYICIVVPYISLLTVLAQWIYGNTFLIFFLLLFMIAHKRSSLLQEADMDSIRFNISSYRVSVMIVTCFCILAVDFKIFPRRYAKAEFYGTSLMDLGVGSFVVANSLVSRHARGISNVAMKAAFRSTSPLIILGFARLISTSSVNYQVHVGEYGVHWNFFFTLAAVAILSSVFNVSTSYCGILGSFILIGYQALLSFGLNQYMLSETRGVDIISQNKEGIFSIFGYWGMYLVGVQLGSYLFFGGNAGTLRSMKWTRARVWALCILFWLISLLLDKHVERVSRRTCNLAYVSLVLATNLQTMYLEVKVQFLKKHLTRTYSQLFFWPTFLPGW
ncbi:uncharacterized protein At4g17910 isoform X1 [Primulina eburnea]|uniref:uncharacterized protein At4g17910 isoform X1 n=1 Tax=Primulina eburnea TaxID=1245227 RepID=UPI003C6C321C